MRQCFFAEVDEENEVLRRVKGEEGLRQNITRGGGRLGHDEKLYFEKYAAQILLLIVA